MEILLTIELKRRAWGKLLGEIGDGRGGSYSRGMILDYMAWIARKFRGVSHQNSIGH
jgi:hypothetical protein